MNPISFHSTCRCAHRQRPGRRQHGFDDAHGRCICQQPGLSPAHGQHEKAEADHAQTARKEEERGTLMTERMKAMQDGMAMLHYMSDAGLGDMEDMQAAPAK